MADIITFRPSLQDKVAIGRILREHPFLNNNVSAAIRVGLAAYHELQAAKQDWQDRRSCELFATELAENYGRAISSKDRRASDDEDVFLPWLQGFAHQPLPGGFAEATIKGRSPIVTTRSPRGKPAVHWFVVGDLVIGKGVGRTDDWYVVPFAERPGMPAVPVGERYT